MRKILYFRILEMDNLTEEERKIVDELRKRTINDMTEKLLEDESVFYRFAKARDFNLADAETMLRKHISWREEWGIDSMLKNYEPPEVLVKYAASTFICLDKEGGLVKVQDFGRVDPKGICNSVTKTEIAKYSVFHTEKDLALLKEIGGNLKKPIYTLIYDFEELTYSKAVNFRGLQSLLNAMKIVLDNYPEVVKTITVINAPIYFAWIFAAFKPILPATVTKKFRVFGSDGWKETLLKDIHADDLPAYLGGNKTDPDGNPLCQTIVQRGQTVPTHYYRQNREKSLYLESDVVKLVVRPFSKEEISFEIKEENLYLEWEFETKKYDIDFSLKFNGEISEKSETVELLPKHRIDTSLETEKGLFNCEKIGRYIVVFDNSYSWIRSKEIFYRAKIGNKQ